MHKLPSSYYYHFPGLERLYDGLMKCVCMYVHMQLPESVEDK